MKDVAISATSPAPNAESANSILGRVVEPKTRWNVASLIAAAIGGIEQATALILTPTKLQVYTPANMLASASNNALDFIVDGSLKFSPVGNTGRSRQIDLFHVVSGGFVDSVGVPSGFLLVNAVTDNPLLNALSLAAGEPVKPTFSLQGLISALVSVIEAQDPAIPDTWSIIVDQFTGDVFLSLNASLTTIRATLASSLFVEFDLSEPGTTVEVAGPVWG